MPILKKWTNIFFVIICVTGTSAFFVWSSSFLSVDYRKESGISLELFAYPKYDLTVNFILEIPRVNISTQIVETRHYNITKTDTGVSVNFHLVCNKSEPIHVILNELKPVKEWSPEHSIYYDLVHDATKNWVIKEHFSSFVAVYTVETSWLNGISKIAIYRDAYHYAEGSQRENHYTTERLPILLSILAVALSLLMFGFTLIAIPDFRRASFRYYPWLTISIVCASVLFFVFWTPVQYAFSLGYFSMLLSYFPHFDSAHLLGNLKLGVISLFLLESWTGGLLNKAAKMKLEILAFIFGSTIIFWLVGMVGFGASYVNEVLGSLLIAYVLYYRKQLTKTKNQFFIYPIACSFAGYALFRYVIDWFFSGYVYQHDLEKANLHVTAFVLGILLVLASFLLRSEIRKGLFNFFRKLRGKRPMAKRTVVQLDV